MVSGAGAGFGENVPIANFSACLANNSEWFLPLRNLALLCSFALVLLLGH